jgi:hypothetical protein
MVGHAVGLKQRRGWRKGAKLTGRVTVSATGREGGKRGARLPGNGSRENWAGKGGEKSTAR